MEQQNTIGPVMREQEKKWREEFTASVDESNQTSLSWLGFLAAKHQDAERIAELGEQVKNGISFMANMAIQGNKDQNHITELRAKLEALEKQEPIIVTGLGVHYGDLPWGMKLYAKPVPATPAIPATLKGCLIERSFILVVDNTYQPILTIRFPIGEDSDGLWLARDTFGAMLAAAAPMPPTNEGRL